MILFVDSFCVQHFLFHLFTYCIILILQPLCNLSHECYLVLFQYSAVVEKYDRNGYKLRSRILVVTDKVNLLGMWQRVLGLGLILLCLIAKDGISLFSFRLYLLGFHYLFRIFSHFCFPLHLKKQPLFQSKIIDLPTFISHLEYFFLLLS